jgi:hypothetical protein
MHLPNIQQGLVDSPLPARGGQLRQHRLAGLDVNLALRPQPDEFLRPNNLKFCWHVYENLNSIGDVTSIFVPRLN